MKQHQACILLAASLLPLSTLWLRAAAADATSNPPTTSIQAAQKETVQRQQMLFSSTQAVSDGQRLLGSGKYDEAAGRFQYALDALTPGGSSAPLYNRAEAGLAAAKAGQANQYAKDNKFALAASKLEEAIALQPNNPTYVADIEQLKKMQQVYEDEVRDPEGTTNNPAVTDEFKGRVATVQKLLFQGDAYFRTGQFEKAEDTYSKILILDPYNKAARNKMDHIEHYKNRAAGFRHEEYEQEALNKVKQGWAESISTDIVVPQTQQAGPVQGPSDRAKIAKKLQTIIIDKVNFDKLDINTVVEFLQQKSKELDPTHEGINFVLRLTSDTETTPGAATPTGTAPATGAPAAPAASDETHAIHREVSITLENVPLADVLGYVINQTNLQFSVEDYAVYLRPSIDEGETLTVRTYLVPPNFFSGTSLRVTPGTSPDAPTTIENVSVNVQQELTDKGIRFPSGATASFLPGSSKLVVRDTPEQLDLIANLIEQLSQETPQVQIEAKVAEFTEDAIKALSFNYLVGNLGAASGVPGVFNSFGAQTQLRTADYPTTSVLGGLTADSVDHLVQTNTSSNAFNSVNPLTGGPVTNNTANSITAGFIIDHTGLAMVINAINNLQGASLLSAPSVTTQNGLEATIDIVREFPYPTSFEKPKLSNNPNLAYTGDLQQNPNFLQPTLALAIPPTPREFVTQDVGVSLKVKPTTYPDQRIDLSITKAQVLDFDGFINYGVPIVTRLQQDSALDPATSPGLTLTPGTINQPVFNVRSVQTNLQVLDGQTAVLGGLIREDTQEVNDKVPILGDIPFVGRLFQSKVSQRTKKNLLFFVTARLIRSNGKPQYIRTLDAEPEEEKLPEPDQQIGPGVILPSLPGGGS